MHKRSLGSPVFITAVWLLLFAIFLLGFFWLVRTRSLVPALLIISALFFLAVAGPVFRLKAGRLHLSLLLLICLLAGLLRFTNLDQNSYWFDELFSINQSLKSQTLTELMTDIQQNESGPPGYWLLLYYQIRWFGDSETATRSLSALFGTAAVIFFYLLIKDVFNARRGLAAALFLGVAYLPIYYAQEVRPYSLLLFLAVLSTYFFWRAFFWRGWRRAGRQRTITINIGGYFLTVFCLMMIHAYGFVMTLTQAFFLVLALLWSRKAEPGLVRARPWQIAGGYLLAGAAFILFWGRSLLIQYQQNLYSWIDKPSGNIFRSFYYGVLGPALGGQSGLLLSWLLVLGGGLVLTAGLIIRSKLRQRPLGRNVLGLAWIYVWLFLPFLLSYAQSAWGTPTLAARNLIISLPAVLVGLYLTLEGILFRSLQAAGRAAAFTAKRGRVWLRCYLRYSLPLAIVLALLLFFSQTARYYIAPVKQDYRAVAGSIIAEAPRLYPDPVIVCSELDRDGLDYYFARAGSTFRVDDRLLLDDYEQKITDLSGKWARQKYLVLVLIHANRRTHGQIVEYLNERFELIMKKRFNSADYYVFKWVSPGKRRP